MIPIKIAFRTSAYHYGWQWIMDAHDCEDGMKVKDFALASLPPGAWEVAPLDWPHER